MDPRLPVVLELDLNSVLSSRAQTPSTGWGWEAGNGRSRLQGRGAPFFQATNEG